MTPTTDGDLLVAVTEMTTAIGTLGGEVAAMKHEVATVKTGRKHDRKMILLLAISVVFDICLSVGLGVVAFQTRHASDLATKASSTQVVDCRAGNATKTVQRDLWNKVFSFPPPAVETPEARATREKTTAEFKTYLDEAFAPQDCAKK